jgi:hypothetical protein
MNIHVQWRLELARDLSTRLRRFPGNRAMVVGGSVARGYSDAYSDLELLVFWDQAPEREVRDEIRSDLGATFRYPEIDPGHDSALLIRSVPVALWHITIASQETTIKSVLDEYSIDLTASNMLDTVCTGIPLHGADLVQQWQKRVREYPDELAIRFLDTYLSHFHLRQLNFAARRDNPTAYYAILSAIQCSLFLVLLAVNHSYFPTYKWMYQRLSELAIGPNEIGARLRGMFHEPPLRAANQLHDVLAETLAIAEARYPQVDTVFARFGLHQAPKEYTGPL